MSRFLPRLTCNITSVNYRREKNLTFYSVLFDSHVIRAITDKKRKEKYSKGHLLQYDDEVSNHINAELNINLNSTSN